MNKPISIIWNSTKTPLILKSRKTETHDTESFYFTTENNAIFNFKPGQFVTLKLEINGKSYARAYSISSLPQQHVLQLTIKRVPNGIVSNWLIDNLEPLQEVWTYGFAGEFNIIDCHPQDKVLFISAGCGITPIMSMAKHLLSQTDREIKDIRFLHCAKSEQSIIYLEETLELTKQHPQFQEFFLLENISDPTSTRAYQHHVGLLSLAHLYSICPDYKEYTVYLCGPSGFMIFAQALLEKAAFDMDNFHQESFSPSIISENLSDESQNTSSLVTVAAPSFGFENREVEKGELLLNILEKGKVPIIGACRSGVCGACKCKVTRGKVETSSTVSLTADQIDQGYVLACSSKVLTDIEVEL